MQQTCLKKLKMPKSIFFLQKLAYPVENKRKKYISRKKRMKNTRKFILYNPIYPINLSYTRKFIL
jgi:hypothetical protein